MRLGHVAAVAGLALGAVGLGLRQVARRALPRSGLRRIAGLDDEVEILRDRWGIPHIFARTEHDLFFGNGVVHAEDRLWQMELNRRAATGRLSEVFGEVTFEVDRFMRRIGLARSARAEVPLLDAETAAVLDAYIAGVNWAIEARPQPVEFALMRYTPEPWTRLDSLAWAKLMSWGLALNWDAELARLRLVNRLGPEIAAELEPIYPAGGWLVSGPGGTEAAAATILESYSRVRELTGLGALGGSNAWAVAPSHSTSGAALLANDMHLAPQMPSVWYELSLDTTDAFGQGFKVAGTSLPGLPGIVVGHNGQIAWGCTASLADVQDLYVERSCPDDPLRFARGDGWEQAEVIREEIRVKGRARWHVEEVVVSSNGPVVTPLLDGVATPIALRASALDPARTLAAGLALNRAQDWDEFRTALAQWASPSLNFVYADAQGNIGFQMAGLVPRRGAGDGSIPAPGWDPAYAWQGYLTLDELPHTFNPPEGFIANANNRPIDDDYPFAIGLDWCDAYRVGRIAEMLQERPKHDRDSFAAIQLDVRSNAARDLLARFADIVGDEQPIDPLERQALRRLLDWDGELSRDSAPAAIYETMRVTLLRFLYAPKLGDLLDLYLGGRSHRFGGLSSFSWRASSHLIRALDRPDWPERRGHRGLSWRDVLMIALGEAVSELRLKLGEEIDEWRWGRIHRVSFEHPLGRIRPLQAYFNRGPYELGGDVDTPQQNGTWPRHADGNVTWLPSYRQVVDFADVRLAIATHTTGQSGQLASPHYDDMIPLWLRGLYHPILWDRADVEEHLIQETRLLPTDELWPKP